jgi:hypothetical protein
MAERGIIIKKSTNRCIVNICIAMRCYMIKYMPPILPQYMMSNQKVAIITGSSSSMGFETSLKLARNGFHTYATMHNLKGREGGSKQIIDIAKNENLSLEVIQLDINNDKSVTEAKRLMQAQGKYRLCQQTLQISC